MSLPCGQTDAGLPVGLQLVGPRFEDRLVVRAGAALEAVLGPLTRPTIHADATEVPHS